MPNAGGPARQRSSVLDAVVHAERRCAGDRRHECPIRFLDVDLALSLKIATEHKRYAYDACLLTCALAQRAPLLTLNSWPATGRGCGGGTTDRSVSMKEFTYSEARQQLATLLEQARRKGAVRSRRRDGQVFVVAGYVKTPWNREVREGRNRTPSGDTC